MKIETTRLGGFFYGRMMADIAVYWDSAGSRGDWKVLGSGLATGSPIVTQILVSVFTDRVAAPDDEIPDGTTNPRGWWGDAGAGHPIGSRLWLLRRAKQTDATLQRAYDYLVEAFQWMIEDKVVLRFDIAVQWVRRGFLGSKIVAYLPDGSSVQQELGWKIEVTG